MLSSIRFSGVINETHARFDGIRWEWGLAPASDFCIKRSGVMGQWDSQVVKAFVQHAEGPGSIPLMVTMCQAHFCCPPPSYSWNILLECIAGSGIKQHPFTLEIH